MQVEISVSSAETLDGALVSVVIYFLILMSKLMNNFILL